MRKIYGLGLVSLLSSGLGIESGLIMTTGKAASAVGPNTSDETYTYTKTDGDEDLNALTGNYIFASDGRWHSGGLGKFLYYALH